MATPFDNRIIPTTTPDNRAFNEAINTEAGISTPDIIQLNPQMPIAKRNRQTIIWRVPGLGKVEMYINPQSLKIDEKKVIKSQRTKGGYVVQYWGEELITIDIQGTSGSSSIEGINILRNIYRAEQNAFQQVAATIADRYKTYTSGTNLTGILNMAANGSGAGDIAGSVVNSLLGGTANPPILPTLGSLATAIEMYYQGWVFKGYFTNFTVDESTRLGPGIFEYKLTFIVFDRRGVRNNFTSSARSPAMTDASGKTTGYYRADYSSVPLSYRGEE